MKPREILTAFDRYLARRSLTLQAVVVGGTALNLLGVVSRPTKDCDIIHPALSPEIIAAARQFASAERARGQALDDDWLNNGPSSLTQHLPSGWQERLQIVFTGAAVTLRCLGRRDLLCVKLWALCDRGIDLSDCLALAPDAEELRTVLPWLETQDAHPDWPEHVRATLDDVAKRLGHAL